MKSIKQESEKKQIVRFNERVNFAGKLLGSQNSPHGLIVLSFDHKNNTIQIKILSKGIEVDNNVVELPIRFRNDPVFFANDKFPSVEDGAEKNKLFYQDEILTLVSDEEGTDTKLITLNTRTSESHVRKIPTYFNGVGRPKYVSFFRDSLLYKISRITDNVLLTVYHVNQEKEILKKLFVQSGNEPKNYFRSDKEMTVGHTGSVKSLLNSTYNWSLILEPKFDKKSTDLLVFVNFYDGKGIGILSMANPAYGLASFAIHTALRQTFGKGAGYSTYCYMVGDTNNSYNLMTQFATDKPIRQLIDDHEIAEGYGKVRFDSKNYQLVKSSVCAVYNIKGRQSLLIVKF
jgi:hypothetical protein